MFKKFGVVTVGVSAGLMMAAPFASATESDHGDDHHDDSSASCEFTGGTGGDAESGDATGTLLGASGLNAGGIGGNNILNIADCSEFLNDNLNGNQVLSNNSVDLGLTDDAPAIPELPTS